MTGVMPVEERQALRQGFLTGDYQFFISNAAVGGMGINELVAAHLVVYYSNTYKWDDRVQSEDRTHRRGQKADHVLYTDLIMQGTVDRLVQASLKTKQDLDVYLAKMLDRISSKELMEML
jgi:SNF2 family DNA or RNA helicase